MADSIFNVMLRVHHAITQETSTHLQAEYRLTMGKHTNELLPHQRIMQKRGRAMAYQLYSSLGMERLRNPFTIQEGN